MDLSKNHIRTNMFFQQTWTVSRNKWPLRFLLLELCVLCNHFIVWADIGSRELIFLLLNWWSSFPYIAFLLLHFLLLEVFTDVQFTFRHESHQGNGGWIRYKILWEKLLTYCKESHGARERLCVVSCALLGKNIQKDQDNGLDHMSSWFFWLLGDGPTSTYLLYCMTPILH